MNGKKIIRYLTVSGVLAVCFAYGILFGALI